MKLNNVEVISVAMIIGGGVLYHLCQKATPRVLDPFLALAVSFGLASFACLGLFIARHGLATAELRGVTWTSIALGASLVLIESGYLIGYRAGLRLNITSFACNTLIALVLLAIGTFFYRESFNLRIALGMMLCVGGLLLLR